MKMFNLAIACLVVCTICNAQQNDATRKYIDAAQKMYIDKNYTGALNTLDSALKTMPQPDADVLYHKIQVLSNLCTVNNDYSKSLESTISEFFKTADKFSFPEDKYADVARINASLQQFKIKDKAFADSVTSNTAFKDLQTSQALAARITTYLKQNPNTYYQATLTQSLSQVNNDINTTIAYSKKHVQDSINKQYLKKAGKSTGIYFSYAMPNGTMKEPHQTFTSAQEVKDFFNGSGDVALGAKFAVGFSVGDIIIPAYTSPAFRFSIDWNFLDAEYSQFDWSEDEIVSPTTLHVIQAGTRIGPSLSFLIHKKMSVAVYYSFRPAVQFNAGILDFADKASPDEAGYIKPVFGNFNMTSEIGAKFRIGFFTLNPFYHFGNMKLKSGIYDAGTDEKVSDALCSYKFTYVGVRIGL
jgi:hypothetical protein